MAGPTSSATSSEEFCRVLREPRCFWDYPDSEKGRWLREGLSRYLYKMLLMIFVQDAILHKIIFVGRLIFCTRCYFAQDDILHKMPLMIGN